MNAKTKTVSKPGVKKLAITVAYDNNPHEHVPDADWGFAAFISGAEKTILFDTGGRFLINNMRKFEIDPDNVDVVVLSHIHGDQVRELGDFLQQNSDVIVYLPKSVSKKFKDCVRDYGAKLIDVKESCQICENVYSTGQFGKAIKENSLIIRTDKGLIVLTGCAHQGILNVVDKAKDLIKDDILLVMGGFHDEDKSLPLDMEGPDRIEEVISAFKKQIRARYVAPCHCCGDQVRRFFKRDFRKKYIDISAGKVITLTDLK